MPPRRSIRRPRRATLSGIGAVFWLALGFAVVIGGVRAADRLPLLVDALLPRGPVVAREAPEDPHDTGTISLQAPANAPGSAAPQRDLAPGRETQTASTGIAKLRGSQTGFERASLARSAPAIAIVIDDLGSDIAATRRAIRLPRAVTLSFLPYPDATPMLAREAERAGHQVLVHVPMEPEGRENPGPHALLTNLSAAEIAGRLIWALARVPGFSGINNHMGSRFTADRAALSPVMATLAERHVFFLDSRTTTATLVVPVARAFGVASAARDVFLDDEQTVGSVDAQLVLTEHVARTQGAALAIGHPHAATLAALEAWVAHLRGFALVPAATVIRLKTERAATDTARNG